MSSLTHHRASARTSPDEMDDRCVLELGDFQRIQPANVPFFAVCTGPYRISFRLARCPECKAASNVRQYQAKIVAISSLPSTEPDDDERAKLGQLDSIAQAQHVMTAKAWVTSREPSAYMGLSVIHSALPKWVLESTARIINDLRVSKTEPFSKVGFKKSVVGNKTLTHVCPACDAALPGFQDDGEATGQRTFTLADQFGETLLYPWPAIMSKISQA